MTFNGPTIIKGNIYNNTNYYYNTVAKNEKQDNRESKDETQFDTELIRSFVTDMHKDEIVKILTNMISPMIGTNKAKETLLPLFCAIFELGWMVRPDFRDFLEAFPTVSISKAAYSKYLPREKRNSEYSLRDNEQIEVLSEQMQLQLAQFLSPKM